MKKIKIFIILIIGLLCLPNHTLASNNEVRLYLFYSSTCPHCAELKESLDIIQKDYPNLKIYKYEIISEKKSIELIDKTADVFDIKITGVPFTVIGTKYFFGYNKGNTDENIKNVIKVYQDAENYSDPVGELAGIVSNTGDLTYNDLVNDNDKEEFIIKAPLFGNVNLKTLSLPIIAILIGTIDGFNPCAMWVLLFLISMLIGMKDRKKMWILGSTFLITSAGVYLLFMLAWLNITQYISQVALLRIFIALIALLGGIFNLRSYVKTKDTGCDIVDEKKRKKVFTKIMEYTSNKNYLISILGIMVIAISVNLIEVTCSAGLPATFTNLLALNQLSTIEYSLYFFLYILFFLIDDLIIFIIAMVTFQIKGISNKFAKYSHLIGGVIMILIALLMIFRPEWLSFKFK